MTSLAPKWMSDKFSGWLDRLRPTPGNGAPGAPDPPASGGPRRRGDGRRPVSEQPKPGSVDDVGARLEALQAAEDALAVERAAQAKRVAALGQCEQGLAQERAQDVADIQRAIDDAIKRFEELQQQLKDEAGNQLNQIAKFNDDYNKAWNKGMDGIDKYLHTYLQLLPGLKNLFDTIVDRNAALEMGHAIDEKIHQAIGAVMAVQGAAGLVRGVAKWVMEDAALEASEAAAGLATKEAAGGLAAKEGVAGLEGEAGMVSKGAQKGVLESAEGAGEAAGKEEVASAAGKGSSIEGEPGFPARDDAWGRRMTTSQPPLDSETKWAINGYTGSDYRGINDALRAGNPGKWGNTVAKLDGAMAPLSEPVTVYRSAPLRSLGEANADPTSLVGKVISDKGFMSTTLQNQASVASGAVKYEIECPAGTMGRYIAPISNVPAEEEVLLARNLQLVVQSVTESPHVPGVWVVKARVVIP